MTTSPTRKVPIHLNSSQRRLLIKNGRIVNDDCIFDADIYIENGIIAQIGQNLIVPGGVRVIDARASSPNEVNYIVPGGIDSHTHLDSSFMGAKSADDYYSGTRAALAGGTTTVMNYALPTKKAPSLLEVYEQQRKLADEYACCDYAVHVGIADWIEGKTEQEIARLVNEHGVNSFKIFLCYPDLRLTDKQVIRVLSTCAKYGAIAIVHCENGDIIDYNADKLVKSGVTGPEGHLLSRPECAEAEATKRLSMLAEQVCCPVMVAHVMSKSAAKIIAEERLSNSCLFGETVASAIATDGSHVFHRCWTHAAAHVMSPPLRPDPGTGAYLLGGLAANSLQVLGSDHCSFSTESKRLGEADFRAIPNGVNGVEERMVLAWEKGVRGGFLDPCKFVAITSTNAAKLFNLYPRKGRIQVGSDADLVIWGRQERVIRCANQVSKGDFNIFEGTRVESGPLVVIAQGRVVLDESGLHASQGSGRYLSRHPWPTLAYGPLKIKSRLVVRPVDRSAQVQAVEEAPGSDDRVAGKGAGEVESKLAELSVGRGQAAGGGAGGQPPSPAPQLAPSDNSTGPADSQLGSDGFHTRTSKSGVKNMQDSTFKLSGEQVDDKLNRSNIRVSGQPPGGRSSGLW